MEALEKIEEAKKQIAREKQESKTYEYHLNIIGTEKEVSDIALTLNKRFHATEFVHAARSGKVSLLTFKCPINGIPIRSCLKKIGYKTKLNHKYVNAPQTNVRNGDENSPNENGEPEAATEGLREVAESSVLRLDGILDSERGDVQNSTPSEQHGESDDSKADATGCEGDTRAA